MLGRGLFKLDTIGDAYVAVGYLQEEDHTPVPCDAEGALEQEACLHLLDLAAEMLMTLDTFSSPFSCGKPLSARIGICVGDV